MAGVRGAVVTDSELGSQQMGYRIAIYPKARDDLHPRILAAAERAGESSRGSGQAGGHTYYRS